MAKTVYDIDSDKILDIVLNRDSGKLKVENYPTGSQINDYNTATVSAGATDNHDYVVPEGKSFYLKQVEVSSQAPFRFSIQIETSANIFETKFLEYSATTKSWHLDSPILIPTGFRVRVTRQNIQITSQQTHTTICGFLI